MERPYEYEGPFKDDSFHGEGTLTNTNTLLRIKGKWEKGIPQQLILNKEGNTIEITIQNPTPDQNSFETEIEYPDKHYSG